MLISFVIPCYRSELTIGGVVEEIDNVMKLRDGHDYEIVCVNDYSPDNVYGKLVELSMTHDNLTVINFAKNFGKHSAVLAAYSFVNGDVVVTLDDDGQCPTERTWELIDALDDDTDIAIARYSEKKESKIKRIGSRFNARVSNILVDQPNDIAFDNFSALKRFVVDEAVKYTNPYPMLVPLLLQITHKIKNVPMEERDRADGLKSGYTFVKSFSLMINGFTNFSVKPLRLATLIGTAVSLLGFIYAVYIIIKRLISPTYLVGYSSTMAVLLVLGGTIMILLGVIGEYIGRMYICVNNSPQYVIKNIVNYKR